MPDAAATVLLGAIEGHQPTPAELVLFAEMGMSGLTLFGRNIPAGQPEAVRSLTQRLQDARPAGTPPLLVAIDQEGGRVRRLKEPFPDHGPAMSLGSGNHDGVAVAEIRAAAKDLGTRLADLGINVDFAPVVDVLTEPGNTAIGDRAFGTDPESVSRRAGAFLAGLMATGVLGCLKHFPGQGAAKVDTHIGEAMVDAPRRVLESRDLRPFKDLLELAPMIMIAHCIYPALDSRPASRSSLIMSGLLRKELGFQGVIVTDDMNMGAVPQDLASWRDAIVEAVAAGADLVLVCRGADRCAAAHQALRAAASKSQAFAQLLNDAAARVMGLRQMAATGGPRHHP